MEGFVQFCLLVSLLLVASDSAEAQKIQPQFKLGGPLTLRPSFSGKITSIVWKFNGNLAAEWADVGVDLTYYASFKGRTTLNIETGELVINKASKDDIGEFVVEINNVVQDQKFEPVEIKDVPDPVVHLRPLSCGSASPSCSLWCDGDIKESGLVTYSWRKGDGEWKESEQVMEITNDEATKKIPTFSCRMKNPVSEKESKAEHNPFHSNGDSGNGGGGGGGNSAVAGIVIAVVLFIIIIGVVFFVWWKKKHPDFCPVLNKWIQSEGTRRDDPENTTTPLKDVSSNPEASPSDGGAGKNPTTNSE